MSGIIKRRNGKISPCFICGAPIEELRLDFRDMKTRPCSHCEAIIQETANTGDDDYEFEVFDDEEFDEDSSVEEAPIEN